MIRSARGMFLLALAALFACAVVSTPATPPGWYKGNTHTHTLWSDGDAAPEQTADWYKSHGYQFLVLSEGEKWKKLGTMKGEVKPEAVDAVVARFGKEAVQLRDANGGREMRLRTLEELRRQFDEPGRFLFIQGEEITDKYMALPIHHNSMNHTHFIKPPGGASVREVLEKTVAAVEAEARQCGRPVLVHLNHPNFGWGVTADDIAHVLGERFFEVYNGHRGVRNYGDKDHLSCEQIWDYVLALRLGKLGGPPLFAFATDDAHNYHKAGETANPGRGWIYVRAAQLSGDAITTALLAGDFYASSGVVLEDVVREKNRLSLRIAAQPGVSYTTRFIGTRKGGPTGEVFSAVDTPSASYTLKGDELYVRATVVSNRRHPNGYDPKDLESAWTQPVVAGK